jgi:hypothetical protein
MPIQKLDFQRAFRFYYRNEKGANTLRSCLRSERMRTVLDYTAVPAVRGLVQWHGGETLYVPARSTLTSIDADPGLPPEPSEEQIRTAAETIAPSEEAAEQLREQLREQAEAARDREPVDIPELTAWCRRVHRERPGDLSKIVVAAGARAGREIARVLQSTELHVPTREAVVRGWRDHMIRETYGDASAEQLAERWDLSPARVKQIARTA